jgi:VWFA-related protein
MRRRHLTLLTFFMSSLVVQGTAQQSTADTGRREGTFKSYTRLVTLELVVKDSKGKHISGLKAEDFQLFEQTPSEGKEKREQKIAEFHGVHVRDVASAPVPESHREQGVYTNAVAVQKDPVPPTILLVDGLNTPIEHQMQVHAQMLKMLRKLPTNVPVAVFLLGDRLTMLQGFTTDPQLLQAALSSAVSNAGKAVAQTDARDDPYAAGNTMGGFSYLHDSVLAGMIRELKMFDQHVYSTQMTARVNRTAEGLISLSRNVAGYPGRKNLLWMSTAFRSTSTHSLWTIARRRPTTREF